MSLGPVCVSGITGFIGAQIVKDLLQKGYAVHGTARSISNPDRLSHITSLPEASDHFKPFSADLLTPGSFDDALEGCTGAIHCASPYAMSKWSFVPKSADNRCGLKLHPVLIFFLLAPLWSCRFADVNDAQKDLIDPAVKGTLSFLESAAKANVPKVIVTSSVAAISDHGKPSPYTEDDWNGTSSVTVMPYYSSKAQAERAAWDFAKEHPGMNLVTVNPFVVIGPSMVASLNESNALLQTMAVKGPSDGGFPGIMDFTLTFVDVRDVSYAHILALESETAQGRYSKFRSRIHLALLYPSWGQSLTPT